MTKIHRDLPNDELHVPKDFSIADPATVLSKDDAGLLEWIPKDDVGGSQGPPGPAGPSEPLFLINSSQAISTPGLYFVDTTTGDKDITIPDPTVPTQGHTYRVYKISTDNNKVTVKTTSSIDIGGHAEQEITGECTGFSTTDDTSEYRIIQDSRAKRFIDSQLPHGFIDHTAILAFDDGTRTFSITPVGGSFEIYNQSEEFIKESVESKVIPDIVGLWLIYYNSVGVLQATQNEVISRIQTPVVYIHWDGTNGLLSEERHLLQMPPDTHIYLHDTLGTVWEAGLAIADFTLDTDTDAAVTFGLTDGEIHDEDLSHNIIHSDIPSDPFEQFLNDPAKIPVAFIDGSSFNLDIASDFAFKNTAAGRVNYNRLNGTWMQQEAVDNNFVAVFIVATSLVNSPIVSIQGQREDVSLTNAQVNNQFAGLVLGDFVSKEIAPLYRIILRTKNTFGGTREAKIVEVIDLRGLRVSEGTVVNNTDHNNGLTGLQGGLASERYHLPLSAFNSIDGDGISSALPALDIDMSSDGIKTKTLAGDTIFTISNPLFDRVISIRLTGDFTITLPSTVKNKSLAEDLYDGTKICTLFIYCIDATTPEYWATLLVGD